MKLHRIAFSCFALAISAAAFQAQAIGRLADVTVVDRTTGATLPVYQHRGEYWVAGTPGNRYAIALRNRTDERVLSVMSVDGVNVVSGETAGVNQGGYVFGAQDSYRITGWRKSNSEVAAFVFTASQNSYASRTGRPDDVGVIGVALFREKITEVVDAAPAYSSKESESRGKSVPAPATVPAPAAADRAAPAAPRANAAHESSAQSEKSSSSQRSDEAASIAKPSAKLGTAHGSRETSRTTETEFERRQSQPNEIIRIRYDSRENLIAAGVIKERTYPSPRSPSAFPGSGEGAFVPDPPQRRY